MEQTPKQSLHSTPCSLRNASQLVWTTTRINMAAEQKQSQFRIQCEPGLTKLFLLFPVGSGPVVLPVSCCVVMVPSPVPPLPRVLRPDPAGYGHRDESAGHHREAALQYFVRPNSFCFSIFLSKMKVNISLRCWSACFTVLAPPEVVDQSCLFIQTWRKMNTMDSGLAWSSRVVLVGMWFFSVKVDKSIWNMSKKTWILKKKKKVLAFVASKSKNHDDFTCSTFLQKVHRRT